MRKTSSLLILGILVVLAVAIYTGYQYWDKSAQTQQFENLQTSISEYENRVLQYQNKKIMETISAKKTLEAFSNNKILWSKIVQKVRSTIPQSREGDIIEVLSYSGSSGNKISMNVRTMEGSQAPYLDVARFIKAFDDSEDFKDGFVPSISAATDDEGNSVLSFSFSTIYTQ